MLSLSATDNCRSSYCGDLLRISGHARFRPERANLMHQLNHRTADRAPTAAGAWGRFTSAAPLPRRGTLAQWPARLPLFGVAEVEDCQRDADIHGCHQQGDGHRNVHDRGQPGRVLATRGGCDWCSTTCRKSLPTWRPGEPAFGARFWSLSHISRCVEPDYADMLCYIR